MVLRASKNRATYFLFTLPAAMLYLFFIVYPILNGLYYSMTDWNGFGNSYQFVGLENYLSYFHDKLALGAVGRTLLYTFWLVVCVTVLATLISLLLNRVVFCKGFFHATYFFPAILSSITIGLIFNQIYYQVVPSLGQALNIAALSRNPLSNKDLAMPAILLINVWQGTSMPTVIMLAGMQSIPNDLYEASRMDGANARQSFFRITLPLLKPTLAVVMIFSLRAGLMVFDYIKATTNGGPGYATSSIAIFIYRHAFAEMKFAYSSAESFLIFLVITLLSLIQIRLVREGD